MQSLQNYFAVIENKMGKIFNLKNRGAPKVWSSTNGVRRGKGSKRHPDEALAELGYSVELGHVPSFHGIVMTPNKRTT